MVLTHIDLKYVSLIYREIRQKVPNGKGLINNMDHLRILGNKPSSVILSLTKWFQKLKVIARKCQNKLKSKGVV